MRTLRINFTSGEKKVVLNAKALVKSWMQLKVLSETDNRLIVQGYDRVVELMLLELFHYSKRHDLTYFMTRMVNCILCKHEKRKPRWKRRVFTIRGLKRHLEMTHGRGYSEFHRSST